MRKGFEVISKEEVLDLKNYSTVKGEKYADVVVETIEIENKDIITDSNTTEWDPNN